MLIVSFTLFCRLVPAHSFEDGDGAGHRTLAADDACLYLDGEERPVPVESSFSLVSATASSGCSTNLLQRRGVKQVQQRVQLPEDPFDTRDEEDLDSVRSFDIFSGSNHAQSEAMATLAASYRDEATAYWDSSYDNSQEELMAQQEYAFTVDEVIEEAFKDLEVDPTMGAYLESNLKRDVTWKACTNINWTLEAENGWNYTNATIAMIHELQLEEWCDPVKGLNSRDPTCKAIFAAIGAVRQLVVKFPEGPKFVNYLLTNWGKYPSWVEGSVSKVDLSRMPPQATVLNANGAIGYGLCDIFRTVLTQSTNQLNTATCGYVASLAALSHKAPAKAIKMGLRMLWTGMATPLIERPCDYIFAQQPGLVPFKDQDGWHPAGANSSSGSFCTGNAIDCIGAQGRPPQNMGLTFMWSQSLIASYEHRATGKCWKKGPAQLIFPGQSRVVAHWTSAVQGQDMGSALWACAHVIDPMAGTCGVLFNFGICSNLTKNDCRLLVAYQNDPVELQSMGHYVQRGMLRGLTIVESVAPLVAKYKRLQLYVDLLIKLSGSEKDDDLLVTLETRRNSMLPTFNEALLKEACTKPVVILGIDAMPLRYLLHSKNVSSPFYPRVSKSGRSKRVSSGCNHAVYLEKCDHDQNEYTIWTWGTTVKVDKDLLLGKPSESAYEEPASADKAFESITHGPYNTGIVCFAIYASKISYAPIR